MSDVPGSWPNPPQYPPQPPPHYPAAGPAPRPRGRSGLAVAAALSGLFAAATVIVAVIAHDSSGSARVSGPSVGLQGPGASGGVAPAGGVSAAGVATVSGPTLAPPSVPSYSPPPTPTHPPLDPAAINRTFEVYMNALVDHDLSALKSATCPRLRHTEVGTALHGNYVQRWRGRSYYLPDQLDYLTIRAKVYLIDPASGAAAGSPVYSWYVERVTSGHYYVCGFQS